MEDEKTFFGGTGDKQYLLCCCRGEGGLNGIYLLQKNP